jgi:hypothetical protein
MIEERRKPSDSGEKTVIGRRKGNGDPNKSHQLALCRLYLNTDQRFFYQKNDISMMHHTKIFRKNSYSFQPLILVTTQQVLVV